MAGKTGGLAASDKKFASACRSGCIKVTLERNFFLFDELGELGHHEVCGSSLAFSNFKLFVLQLFSYSIQKIYCPEKTHF